VHLIFNYNNKNTYFFGKILAHVCVGMYRHSVHLIFNYNNKNTYFFGKIPAAVVMYDRIFPI